MSRLEIRRNDEIVKEDTQKRESKQCAIYERSRREGVGGIVDQILACRVEADAHSWIVDEQHVFSDSPHEAAIASEKPTRN